MPIKVGDCVFIENPAPPLDGVERDLPPRTGVIKAITTDGQYLVESPDGQEHLYRKGDISRPKEPRKSIELKSFIKLLYGIYEEVGNVPVLVGTKPISGLSSDSRGVIILV